MDVFFVYITTNSNRTVLYIGVTNDLSLRLQEHHAASLTTASFTGKYKAHHLLYFEEYSSVLDAIAREKQLKGWTRAKKEALIQTMNPTWRFLETEL